LNFSDNFIDAHCHLTDDRAFPFAKDWIQNAKDVGVVKVRLGGLYPEEWAKQRELQKEYPDFILNSFGLHPWWVERLSHAEIDSALNELEKRMSEAQAIGETGLDFYSKRDPARFAEQERVFRAHLRLAKKYQKPVVLHVVKAHERAIKIIREENAEVLLFQVHSFSGSLEIAAEWLKLNAYLSFSGGFLKETARRSRDVLRAIPANRVLFETDSPDQAWREDGKNEPALVAKIYQRGAQVLDLPITSLKEIVAENFSHFE
jgi:TatD DNase family protein